jgi:hypothetical protein
MNKTIKGGGLKSHLGNQSGGLKSHLGNQRRRIEIAPGQLQAGD